MLISSHAIHSTLEVEFIAAGWQQASSPFGTTNVNALATNDEGQFVAVGSSGKIGVSTDVGFSWALQPSPFAESNIYAVGYGDGIYVAGGSSGKLATSSDGSNWTLRTSSFGASAILSVTWSPLADQWVAVGASGKLATSIDGIEWTQRTSSFGVTFINTVYSSPNLLVAAGYDGKLATSTNGVNWTQRSSSFVSSIIYDVVSDYTGSTYLAVGDSGKIAISYDGISWSQTFPTSTFGSSSVKAVDFNGGGYLAGGSAGKLATSNIDGLTWTQRSSGLGLTNINDVFYSETVGIAVADSGKIIYSV